MSTITISTGEVETYQGSETAPLLRVFVSKNFVASDGDTIMRSSFEEGEFYKEVSCTIVGGVITYPAFTVDSTEDALSNSRDARYRFDLFTITGNHIQNLFTGMRIPATPITTTLGAIAVYNDTLTATPEESEEGESERPSDDDPTVNNYYFEDFDISPSLIGAASPLPELNMLRGGGSGADWQGGSYDDESFGSINAILGTSLSNRVDLVHKSSDIADCFFDSFALTFATRMKFVNLPTALQNYAFIFGFFSTSTTDPVFDRGVLFRCQNGLNGGKFLATCRDNAVELLNTDIDTTLNTFNKAAHGLLNDQVVYAAAASVMPSPLVTETPYYVVNKTTDTFQISLTLGGSPVDMLTAGDWMMWFSKETSLDTGVTPVADTWYVLRIEIAEDGTAAQFYIDGDLVATITTNIPVGSTKRFTAELNNDRLVGTTLLTATSIDYLYFKRHVTVSRLL